MGQEKGRDGGSAAGSDLIRDLRDVGTGKIKHIFAGTCPEVWEAGNETENDRADPQDGCEACEVLRRADDLLDQVSDRSDTVGGSSIGAVAFPDDVDTETLRELDAFREKMLGLFPRNLDESAVILDTHLHKVRAHIVADELERRRLQGEILRSTINPDGRKLFSELQILRILDLKPGWEIAPQQAKSVARKIPT